MEFHIGDLRLVKPFMLELKESDPARYERITAKYNEVFKDLKPNAPTAPTIPEFLKDIFCNE